MKIAIYLIAALLAFFGLMFVVGSQGMIYAVYRRHRSCWSPPASSST